MNFSTVTDQIILVILSICSLVLTAYVFLNMYLSAPFVPSSRKASKKLIEAANLNSEDIVFDLGSGDGRLIIMAGKEGVKRAVGFELNPLLNIYARLKARFFRLKNTVFLNKSMWNADLSKCNKLFVYLSIKNMNQLESKIQEEMKSGSYIYSNTFSFPNLKPIKVIDNKIKVYKIEK